MRKLAYVVLLIIFGLQAFAQLGGGTTYQFLNLVAPARIAALGGKPIAAPESDVHFGAFTPSLLDSIDHNQLALTGVSHPGGVGFGDAYYARHYKKWGTFLLGMRYVDYGSFVAADFNGQQTGTFTATDFAFQVGWGYRLDTNWSVGANWKLINSALETYVSWGMAWDLSATYQIPKHRFAVTAMVRNLGFQFGGYHMHREPLPFELALGISNRFEHLPFRWHITFDNLQQLDLTYENPDAPQVDPLTGEPIDNSVSLANKFMRHVILGGELQLGKSLNVQVGYNFRRQQEMKLTTRRSSAGFSFGVGLKVSKFRINYGRTIYHVAGASNHFSVVTNLDDFKKKIKPAPTP